MSSSVWSLSSLWALCREEGGTNRQTVTSQTDREKSESRAVEITVGHKLLSKQIAQLTHLYIYTYTK